MNIIMNIPDVDLGPQLRAFKGDTRDLPTPLRGQALTYNTFIRAIHNSLTRRMEFLNSDLWIQNEETETQSKKKRKQLQNRASGSKAAKKPAARRKAKKRASDSGYHFAAYVPADDAVWELDGLMQRPLKLGDLPVANRNENEGQNGEGRGGAESAPGWMQIAAPHIQARMSQYLDNDGSFNLIAVCRDPTHAVSHAIAANIRALETLDERMRPGGGTVSWDALVAAESGDDDDARPIATRQDGRLGLFGLSAADVASAQPARPSCGRPAKRDGGEPDPDPGPRHDLADALALRRELVTEQRRLMAEHRDELGAADLAQRRVQGRKRDFTPAIHAWVKRLAEKGILESIFEQVEAGKPGK